MSKRTTDHESPRVAKGNLYGGAYLFPCILSDDCGGVLLWEDHRQPDDTTSATVICSDCGTILDGGIEDVYSSGVSVSGTVNSGGVENVKSGGTTTATTSAER